MHGVAPRMCGQVGRPLLGRGAGGRSPGYLPAERLAVGLLAYVLMGSALGRTGGAPTAKIEQANNGVAYSLDQAKEQFKQRYEEMKAQGVRPFSGG
jgi:hypothetical protein